MLARFHATIIRVRSVNKPQEEEEEEAVAEGSVCVLTVRTQLLYQL